MAAPSEKDKRIADLERRVEDLEQYSRINYVLITGLRIKPRSYAHVAAADSGAEPGDLEVSSTEQQVAAFLEARGIEVGVENIQL